MYVQSFAKSASPQYTSEIFGQPHRQDACANTRIILASCFYPCIHPNLIATLRSTLNRLFLDHCQAPNRLAHYDIDIILLDSLIIMASIAAEGFARSSSDSARTRNLAHTASTSQENPRNQSSTSHYSNQDMVRSVADKSPGHIHSGDGQFDHSRLASQVSPPEPGRPPFNAVTPSDVHDTRGQTAAPASRLNSSPTIASTALFFRMLKWSMETKMSIFQIICTVFGLGVAILFGVYALKQGNTSTQVGDRSLAISMWQVCMQFPNSPVFLFTSCNVIL